MSDRIRIPALMAIACGLAAVAGAQATPDAAKARTVMALHAAMDPGEGHRKLEPMVGTFDVRVRTWLDPSQPPVESMAVAVSTWVLGNRYVQTMLSGFTLGEAWNGIAYAGYDTIAKKYVATYMDSGGTGMDWFTGLMSPDGKSGTLAATSYDAITLEPVKTELRLRITPSGDHVTEVWQADRSGKWVKMIELQYTRRKS